MPTPTTGPVVIHRIGFCCLRPPGTPAAKYRFPARNRIVAALGKVVVVVEGAEGSGSRITADFALDIDRDVLCVPGPVTSPLSAVPHALIREGAGLVRGAADVLHALRVYSGAGGPGGGELLEAHRRALDALAGSASTLEEVVTASGLPAGDALAALMALEIRGLVRSVGGRYERTLLGAGVST
jgi:DNA processing protein